VTSLGWWEACPMACSSAIMVPLPSLVKTSPTARLRQAGSPGGRCHTARQCLLRCVSLGLIPAVMVRSDQAEASFSKVAKGTRKRVFDVRQESGNLEQEKQLLRLRATATCAASVSALVLKIAPFIVARERPPMTGTKPPCKRW